ncbi:alkaline phosphatase family protein [Marinoscillum furvescens]|uniref:Putative AlkP superfamily pyrophosphatase or phosphodiesterase n=1 Tax=Marinoscillum furvescens DSM 4134 TaxID=1122208 RepID=A0A3D9L6E8_MARFU|nr:ectonucleotide pyrophosphatase/phosphodiesterase [Marinoscillum furvescens]REE01266.1 putative AlkP superfamily pyrophosphatase or phosphodiesterase [Marinoscillum furvescens DSM 4134]
MNNLPLLPRLHLLMALILLVSHVEAQHEKLQTIDRENGDWALGQPYVVLISIDGFRYDYAEKFGAKNLCKLANDGVTAEKMYSAFPTKTFPNHYTIVTGMYPANHGLVSNEFYSRSMDAWYRIRDRSAVQNPAWYGGVPLWVLAEQQQMLSASFFWVGSEAPIEGIKPTYNYSYDGSISNKYRFDQVVDWLELPARKRPHMILAYFSLVDDAGHRYGPDHEKTGEAVLELDSLIGDFMRALEGLELDVNVVVVSDHGMASISRGIVLPEVVDLQDSRVSYSFPPMIYQKDPSKVDDMYERLLKVENLQVFRKNALPDYMRFENEDRVGDLVLLTSPPTVILSKPGQVYGGTHGFDPFTSPEMGAYFSAFGPQVKRAVKVPAFENVHVYPFIARMLGLEVSTSIDGKPEVLEFLLK